MKMLIFKQGIFGGTDQLLDRYFNWQETKGYVVDSFVYGKDDMGKLKGSYDLALIPTSQMGDVYCVIKKGIKIKRLLVWVLGGGAFYETYFNPGRDSRLEKMVYFFLKIEADRSLKWLWNNHGICFTDIAGVFSSIENTNIEINDSITDRIVPIAVEIPERQKDEFIKKDILTPIRFAWIGRVSSDFKEIPIIHMIKDLFEWQNKTKREVQLTIVGTGDALENVKNTVKSNKINTMFIDNIPYEKLGQFIRDNVDILFAMGTSAIDGAKVGCPTVVISPVRPEDEKTVTYRWIFESVGLSLGEYPKLNEKTGQIRKNFESIMTEYFMKENLGYMSYEYSLNFAMEDAFQRLYEQYPNEINAEMMRHLQFFYKYKKIKSLIKKLYLK